MVATNSENPEYSLAKAIYIGGSWIGGLGLGREKRRREELG